MSEKRLNAFKRLNTDEVNTNKVILYNGTILIFEDALAEVLKVTKRSIQKYKVEGLQVHKTASKTAIVYDFIYAVKWYENHSKKSVKSQFKHTDKEEVDLESADVEDIERMIKIQKLKTDSLKHKQLSKELINAEDLDRGMAEQAVMHVSFYQDDLSSLPSTLANKSEEFINKFLSEHYESRIVTASTFINKVYKAKSILHKKILEFMNE